MRVIKKHKSAFERQVQESILIELNQVDGNILNSKSGFNRCLIPRMTIMMGDRVVEDKPDSKEAAEDEVETAFEARDKRSRKSRSREEGVKNNNNLNNNYPPPPKRRRKIIRSQNIQKVSSHLVSIDNDSDPVCDKPLPSDQDQTNVGIDARVPPQSEQKQDNIPLITPSAEKKYFPVFNLDLPRQLTGRGKQSKFRKMKSTPANNPRITDHFRPTRTNSKKRDDENIHLAPASVDRCLLSSSPRDQVPRRL